MSVIQTKQRPQSAPKTKLLKGAGTLLLASSLFASYTMAEENPDLTRLMAQGYYWLQQGHPEQAKKAWEKALRISPNNEEASNGLKLITQAPNINKEELATARQLTSDNKFPEAITQYQNAFGGTRPPLALATEYYETLAATPAGKQEALIAIADLLQQFPNHLRLQLVQAKLQTYDEKTRRTGINTLEQLSQTPALHDEALAAWKQALIWLQGKQSDSPSYSAYLQQVPTDSEVHQHLKTIARDNDGNIGEAWSFLEQGSRTRAEKAFTQILKSEPNNSDALAGLGLIRIEQQRFNTAKRLLEKAIAQDPSKKIDLSPALNTSRYWSLFRRAETQRRNGQLTQAKRTLTQANKYRSNRHESLQLQGNIEADLGNTTAAIRLYRRLLKKQPNNVPAQKALVGLLLQTREVEEAEKLVTRYRLPQEKFIKQRNQIEARQLRSKATELNKQGDREGAIHNLLRARLLDPENIWIRHDLGLLYIAENRINDAYLEVDEILENQPLLTEALFARALLSSEANAPYPALMILERIIPQERNAEHKQLQHQLWREYQLSRITELMRGGDVESALALSDEIKEQAGEKPEARMVYASALAEAQQPAKAIDEARLALALSPAPSIDLQLQYAAVLLKTQQDKKLETLIDTLSVKRSQFSNAQASSYEGLSMALSIKEANALRKKGSLAKSYEQLRPWLDSHPESPDLLLTMAALYNDSGDTQRAEGIYNQVIQMAPENPSAWSGAAGSAMSSGDYSSAEKYVEQGLTLQPDSSDLLALRGIIQRLSGNQTAAARDFRSALERYESKRAGRDSGSYPLDVVSGVGLRLVGNTANAKTLFPYAPWEKSQAAKTNEPLWLDDARTELALLNDQINTSFYTGLKYRSHSGTSGRSELTHTEMPIGIISRINPDQAWGAEIRPTSLNAGGFSYNQEENLLIGSTALDTTFLTQPPSNQKDSGTGVSLWFQHKDWEFNIGTTPSGFEESNINGGINWSYEQSGLALDLGLNRRAVKESLLSWAGTKDPHTGDTWGGVMRDDLDFGISQSIGKYGIYGELKLSSLGGEGLADNQATDASVGVYWKVNRSADKEFTVGTRLHHMSFDENQRYFTLGHGGYFSPQNYLALTFPMEYSQRKGSLRYKLSADIGLYHYEEDGASLYPNDPVLQTQLEDSSATLPASLGTGYAENDDTGLSYQLSAEIEYNLTPSLSLSATLMSNNASDYRENSAWGHLRYYFNPRTSRKTNLNSPKQRDFSLPGEDQ